MEKNPTKFYFSAEQKKLQRNPLPRGILHPEINPSAYTEKFALLDNGEVVEYTEGISGDYGQDFYKDTPPHNERWKDSKYLGTGKRVDFDSVINDLEKDF